MPIIKHTLKKGLFRLAMVTAGVLVGYPFADSFSFLVICALLSIGWVFYRLVGGFVNVE